MDSFLESLGEVELEEDFELIREKCFREEGEGLDVDEDFKQRFLSRLSRRFLE